MHNYTVHLTNGIYLPPYQVDKDHEDDWLLVLGHYLLDFINVKNIRHKIKTDFELDSLFEESKQNQAFKKIQKQNESLIQESIVEKS